MHGREKEAEEAIRHMEIESGERGELPALDESKAILLNPVTDVGYFALARVLFS
jgi:hypothetical protein